MTTDQFDRALGQSTSTDKVLSLRLPKRSNENQRSTLHPNEIHCLIVTISVRSRPFHEDRFVGNPWFNMNSLLTWVTAYLSGPKVPMKVRSCNHAVQKTKRKQRVVTIITIERPAGCSMFAQSCKHPLYTIVINPCLVGSDCEIEWRRRTVFDNAPMRRVSLSRGHRKSKCNALFYR